MASFCQVKIKGRIVTEKDLHHHDDRKTRHLNKINIVADFQGGKLIIHFGDDNRVVCLS